MKDINISVNGKNIGLTEFPSEIIANSVYGMVKTLKGVGEIKEIQINITY